MTCRSFGQLMPVLLLATSVPAGAMQTEPGTPVAAAPVKLTAQDRQDIVAKISEAMRNRYVFPDVGERAAARINAALAAGKYDTMADPATFAARLSADLQAVAHDKHLQIWSDDAPPAPPVATGEAPRAEAGITRADRLAGGIGYIEVIGFPPLQPFKQVLNKAMSSLAGSRALIIDDRRNGGGSPESVAYLVSFLVAPGRPINDIVSRVANTVTFTRESYRSVPTPINFAKVPVFVLTSKDTFSGGEEFAYDVQALIPIIENAGGIVMSWTGTDAQMGGHVVAAATPELHAAALEILSKAV